MAENTVTFIVSFFRNVILFLKAPVLKAEAVLTQRFLFV